MFRNRNSNSTQQSGTAHFLVHCRTTAVLSVFLDILYTLYLLLISKLF